MASVAEGSPSNLNLDMPSSSDIPSSDPPACVPPDCREWIAGAFQNLHIACPPGLALAQDFATLFSSRRKKSLPKILERASSAPLALGPTESPIEDPRMS